MSPLQVSLAAAAVSNKKRCGVAVANDMGIHVAHDSHVIEIQIQQQLCAAILS